MNDELPDTVQALYDAIEHLPGVRSVEMHIQPLDGIIADELGLPGEYADLPHALLRRTDGGKAGETMVTAEVTFGQDKDGWTSLEFLAWWVRDLSRSGAMVQLRPVALPPRGFGLQLGRTLRFLLEFFFQDDEPKVAANDDDVIDAAIFARLGEMAASLQDALHTYGEELDNPTATDWQDIAELKTMAERGDAEAMVEFGLLTAAENDPEDTEAAPPDAAAAFVWYVKAAELGHPEGALQAGMVLASGEGAPQDTVRAVAYYAQAAEAGHPLAMALLGQAHQKGEGVVQDEAKAAEWYAKGGDAGEAACWAQLGDCYENGIGVKQDHATALELYERAAEAGFLDVEEAMERIRDKMK